MRLQAQTVQVQKDSEMEKALQAGLEAKALEAEELENELKALESQRSQFVKSLGLLAVSSELMPNLLHEAKNFFGLMTQLSET